MRLKSFGQKLVSTMLVVLMVVALLPCRVFALESGHTVFSKKTGK